MRKLVLPLLVMAAMLLAACSGAAGTAAPTGAATTAATTAATSAAGTTPAATSAATMAATSATTGTPAATSATTGTPAVTSAATTAATPAATTATTGTPAATQSSSNSSNGATASSKYVSLMALLKGQVNAKDSTSVGQVTGILVQHPEVPAAGQPTPTAAPASSAQSNFTIRYILVKASGTATGSGSTGDTVVTPWQAFDFSSASLTATSYTLTVDSAAFNSAPRTTLQDVSGSSSAWASAVDPFWTGKGLSIPMTGTSSAMTNPGNSLFLVTSDNDALKIADQAKTELGATSDVLVDAATGQIAFFQFNGGSALGNKTFVVPASLVSWTPGSSPLAVNNEGEFTLNFPNSVFSTFPSINLTNGLDQNTLNQLLQFWQSISK